MTMTFRSPILMLTILGLASACTPHDDGAEPPKAPVQTAEPAASSGGPVKPAPEPEQETVTVSVASVQLQDDCPAPAPDSPSQPKSEGQVEQAVPYSVGEGGEDALGERGATLDYLGDRGAPPCVQSSVQLSIVSRDSKALPFSIRTVRLRKSDGGGAIETMRARVPTIWEGSGYVPWDESVAPASTLKVSYVLGAPDWAAVEKVLEESSWSPLYIVEFEVEVAGRIQTVSSPLAPREAEPEIVT